MGKIKVGGPQIALIEINNMHEGAFIMINSSYGVTKLRSTKYGYAESIFCVRYED